jgi:hypothetical protein
MVLRPVTSGRASPLLAHEIEVGDFLQVYGPYGFLTWTEADGAARAHQRWERRRPARVDRALRGRSGSRCADDDAVLESGTIPRAPARDARGTGRPASVVERHPHLYAQRLGSLCAIPPASHIPILAEVLERGGSDVAGTSFSIAGPGDIVLSVRSGLGELGVAQSSTFDEDHG